MVMTKGEIETLLKEARIGVFATIKKDGAPHMSPMWYIWEDEAIKMWTSMSYSKCKNVLRDSRSSFCVAKDDPPYKGVVMHGEAETSREGVREVAYKIVRRYLGPEEGEKYVQQGLGSDSVIIKFIPQGSYSWDYGKE